MERAGRVTVDLFTIDGQRVITLVDGVLLAAGLHDWLSWNGTNGDGSVVRNGIYLLRVDVDGPKGGRYLRKVAVAR